MTSRRMAMTDGLADSGYIVCEWSAHSQMEQGNARQALSVSRRASVAEYRVMGDGIYRGIGRCMLEMRPAAIHFECVIDHFRCVLVGTVL